MKNVLWIIVAAVIFAAYTCFSKIQDEIITFNDAVIDLLDRMKKSFQVMLIIWKNIMVTKK